MRSVHPLLVGAILSGVAGHGRLIEPPSRASMWRYGFPTPHDYQDNEGFCGGFAVQWEANGGRCGLCGDAWDDPIREHEAPDGRFATGTIVREYAAGQAVDVTVEITSNHWGSFTFRVCPAPGPGRDPDQACMDANLLTTDNGRQEWRLPSTRPGLFHLQVLLPPGLTCQQCVLQWTYRTGNSWGVCEDGSGAIGCGAQEHFRACADITIGESSLTNNSTSAPPTSGAPASTVPSTTWPSSTGAPWSTGAPSAPCSAIGAFAGIEAMDAWCNTNCYSEKPYCPTDTCACAMVP